jgi:TonB family protein
MAPIISTVSEFMQAAGVSSVSLSAYGGGGRGDGLGPGTGPGLAPGRNGGFGGDAYSPGGGITSPVPIRKPTPAYTAEALRTKVQGSVEVEAIVLEDGTVGDVRIHKSLDRISGMDQEALRVAKQWLFQPARDPSGKPVKTIVKLIFDLRLF